MITEENITSINVESTSKSGNDSTGNSLNVSNQQSVTCVHHKTSQGI